MKKFFRIVLPILLTIVIIVSTCWYLFIFDRDILQELFLYSARSCTQSGDYNAAAWFYQQAYKHSGQDDQIALELAGTYLEEGNFTKAEYTLSTAISHGATADLYTMLCRTYVMQDKLLDAVNMLDKISDPDIKEVIDNQRPQAPSANPAPGFYNQYLNVEFTYSGGDLYYTTNGEYPSQQAAVYTEPIPLSGGETMIYAIVVGEDGLVSPVAIYGYTIGGVVEPVTLADPAVDSAVRQVLGLGAADTIYSNDLWSITEFTVPEEAATLEDLRYMTYLRSLSISSSNLVGSETLAALQQLEQLSITDSKLRTDNLSIIAALPKLTSLTLSNCGLTTAATLANAQNLTHLNLSNNSVQNIDVLASMYLLEELDLSQNAVTSLAPLSGLINLNKLNVSGNSLADITPIITCAKLEWLDVSKNSISALHGLDNLSKLTYLNASNNALPDISVLAGCGSIQELNLSNNSITTLDAIASMHKLLYLDVSSNFLTALPQLDENCSLVTFAANKNYLADISPLGNVDSLNNVYVDYNNLTDIAVLGDCPNMVRIHAYANPIPMENVQPLLDMGIIVQYDPTFATATEATEGGT